ncbi:hypothetical protein CYMTET_44181 [Cymbomonas tetramitiformis]|uniref:Uncharacterized protein n=1 Tax=Cymbomonas tetramitiformis TaxID=36881 RepID=A0AAE0EZA4_9CHLO|nr:hypothetical protein CYMTET_44181 [Cymbomonas tetramitiformis]
MENTEVLAVQETVSLTLTNELGSGRKQDEKTENGVENAVPTLDKLEKLGQDTKNCLSRLDQISKKLNKSAGPLPAVPPIKSFHYMPDITALADIDAQIEFAKNELERRQAAKVDAKKRFEEIEVSIRKREDHVNNMLECLTDIPD